MTSIDLVWSPCPIRARFKYFHRIDKVVNAKGELINWSQGFVPWLIKVVFSHIAVSEELVGVSGFKGCFLKSSSWNDR